MLLYLLSWLFKIKNTGKDKTTDSYNSNTRVYINTINLCSFERLIKYTFKKFKTQNKNPQVMTSALFQKDKVSFQM